MKLRRTFSSRPVPRRSAHTLRRTSGALVVLMAMGLAACNDVGSERPAAELGDITVSTAALDSGMDALSGNPEFIKLASGPQSDGSVLFENGEATPAMKRLWLGLLIQRAIITNAFEERNASLGPKDQATAQAEQFFGGADVFAGFSKAFRDESIADQQRRLGLAEKVKDLPVSDAEVRAAYEQRYGKAACPTGRSVAHILVADDKAAQDVLDELAAGGDFAALAKERSTDPGSSPSGGELGCLVEGQFVPEFEQAALDAPLGEPVGPVKTQFGSHVILVTPFEAPPLDEVEAQLRAELEQAATQADPVSRLLVQALTTEDISIDPAIGSFDRTTLSVAAPGEGSDGEGGGSIPSAPLVRDGR